MKEIQTFNFARGDCPRVHSVGGGYWDYVLSFYINK